MNEVTAYLKRFHSDDMGTQGRLEIEERKFMTLELPWRENQKGISCIPPGRYLTKLYVSSKFGHCLRLYDTEPRSDILIHVGNYAGDKAMKFKSDSEGCILVGDAFILSNGQTMVINSRKSLNDLIALVQRSAPEGFYLEIQE